MTKRHLHLRVTTNEYHPLTPRYSLSFSSLFNMTSLTRLTTTASACLLYILTLGPARLRDPAIRLLAGKNISIQKAKEILKTLLKIGIFLESNNLLNIWARNNWRITNKEKWDWPNEVAVVTGGSGGIGVLVVEGLAKKGVRVAVLDLLDLPEKVAGCMLNQIFEPIEMYANKIQSGQRQILQMRYHLQRRR
jgi:hypothetical protein